MKLPLQNPEFHALIDYSARLGRNPLLVQGSTGNTSIKIGDTLWIKASGHWLANAREECMFVPVDISAARYSIGNNTDPSLTSDAPVRASVETAMHCVIPHRIVIHVHSVSSIVWAVRRDSQSQLAVMLDGIRWKWIPYVASGLPLARAIEAAVFADPGAQAFILGNHGVVTAGPDCESALAVLAEIEKRLGLPSRLGAIGSPADAASIDAAQLAEWLRRDATAKRVLAGGYLYPCHALYLSEFGGSSICQFGGANQRGPYLKAEIASALSGLAGVISRIPAHAPLRYLAPAELEELMAANVYQTAAPKLRQSALQTA